MVVRARRGRLTWCTNIKLANAALVLVGWAEGARRPDGRTDKGAEDVGSAEAAVSHSREAGPKSSRRGSSVVKRLLAAAGVKNGRRLVDGEP